MTECSPTGLTGLKSGTYLFSHNNQQIVHCPIYYMALCQNKKIIFTQYIFYIWYHFMASTDKIMTPLEFESNILWNAANQPSLLSLSMKYHCDKAMLFTSRII